MELSKIKTLSIGDKITVSNHASATWFEITDIGPGAIIEINDSCLNKPQIIDIDQVVKHNKQ